MYINIDTPIQEIQNFLHTLGFLNPQEFIQSVTKPGEGNMNVVLRVQTRKRSFIVKQSRPFVQKYQNIPAPLDRIAVEYAFYKAVSDSPVNSQIPKNLAYFPQQNTLILEDLGRCEVMTAIYDTRTITRQQLKVLVQVLQAIHSVQVDPYYPENTALRALNHQHIFVLPFLKDNGFSLNTIQDGLEAISQPYKNDEALQREIQKVGAQYLAQGHVLLHGDYYPGSWMTLKDRTYIIDPEFSFKGFADFDLGVLAAHLIIATMNQDCLSEIKKQYQLPINSQLFYQVTGIEIMRRLIGLAQLPLQRTLAEKKQLLEMGYKFIMKAPV